jgi:hypothetical protein
MSRIIKHFLCFRGILLVKSNFDKFSKRFGIYDYFQYVKHRWLKFSVGFFGSLLVIYLLPLLDDWPEKHDNYASPQQYCRYPYVLSSFFYYSNWNNFIYNYTFENVSDLL